VGRSEIGIAPRLGANLRCFWNNRATSVFPESTSRTAAATSSMRILGTVPEKSPSRTWKLSMTTPSRLVQICAARISSPLAVSAPAAL